MNVTGNTILITGGGSGIGRALAHAFHDRGNRVIVTGRRKDALDETAAGREGVSTHVLDVKDAGAVSAFAAEATRTYPELNVLINNAGVMLAEDLTAEPVDLAKVETTIATNLLGPIRLTAALLPHLKAQPAATVVNVSSGLAFVPLALTPTYSATKAALHSWSQSLRRQLEGGSVQVVELAPPAVATDLMPGHAESPRSMPLADYVSESMALFEADPDAPEIMVERVKPLRNAEASGSYVQVFGMVNGPR